MVVVIYSASAVPLERFLFDLSAFPVVPTSEGLTIFDEEAVEMGDDDATITAAAATSASASTWANAADVEEQFRAVMSKLAGCGSLLGTLPEGCSFTVAIELKDDVEAPIGHPQPWIPSPPTLQRPTEGASDRVGQDLGGVRTHPIRNVESGELVLELWIEEGREKRRLQEGAAKPSTTPT